MANALRIIIGALFVAGSALLSLLAPDAPAPLRGWAYAGVAITAFVGAVLFAEQFLLRSPTDESASIWQRLVVGIAGRVWAAVAAVRPAYRWAGGRLRRLLRPIGSLARELLGMRPVRPLRGTRVRRARMLPPQRSAFRGRATELNHLLRRHREARGREETDRGWWAMARLLRRTTHAGAGPLLFVIYGMPGVGKSALAQEFAYRVLDGYPDGQFYYNLGSAGSSRSAGEVLRGWLVALGWPLNEMPPDAYERAKIFRSLTDERRMLFILDAARDTDQVLDLMPTGSGCMVIVTSRRDLGPSLGADEALSLEVPSIDEALELIQVYTPALSAEQLDQEHAIRVIELCGRLPGALRSVCDRISDHEVHVGSVADMLRLSHSRTAMLETDGRGVVSRIATEYARLDDPEKEILRYLTLVRTDTFVPWVASALLNIALEDAEDRVA
jgi:hypothetical protein